jgi:hypothetical protein
LGFRPKVAESKAVSHGTDVGAKRSDVQLDKSYRAHQPNHDEPDETYPGEGISPEGMVGLMCLVPVPPHALYFAQSCARSALFGVVFSSTDVCGAQVRTAGRHVRAKKQISMQVQREDPLQP